MASTKFPNAPKPIVGACSDGFPKPIVASPSESSEFICFQEPLLAFQPTRTVNAQVPRHVNPTISNLQPQFQPDVRPDASQPIFVLDDPWNEDVDHVAQSINAPQLCFKNPVPVKFPTLLKVREDPYDPWNSDVCDLNIANLFLVSVLNPNRSTKNVFQPLNHTINPFSQRQGRMIMIHGTLVNCCMGSIIFNQPCSHSVPTWWTLEMLCRRCGCHQMTCSVWVTFRLFLNSWTQ